MSYIGKQPSPAVLTSSDIPDLPATKITSGTFPALNGSNLTNLDAADLSGTLPSISGANLTGIVSDVVRLGSVDSSSANSINIDLFSSTYEYYHILIRMEQETYSATPRLRVRQGGSTITGSSYLYTWGGSQVNSGGTGNTQNGGSTGSDHILLNVWNTADTNHQKDIELWVYHPLNASNQKPYFSWTSWGKATSGEAQHIQGFGYYDNSTNLSGLHIYETGSNSVTWSAVTFGYKHS